MPPAYPSYAPYKFPAPYAPATYFKPSKMLYPTYQPLKYAAPYTKKDAYKAIFPKLPSLYAPYKPSQLFPYAPYKPVKRAAYLPYLPYFYKAPRKKRAPPIIDFRFFGKPTKRKIKYHPLFQPTKYTPSFTAAVLKLKGKIPDPLYGRKELGYFPGIRVIPIYPSGRKRKRKKLRRKRRRK